MVVSTFASVVILWDGEKLPAALNTLAMLVYRQGDSTNRQAVVIKPRGMLLPDEELSFPVERNDLTNPDDSGKVGE